MPIRLSVKYWVMTAHPVLTTVKSVTQIALPTTYPSW